MLGEGALVGRHEMLGFDARKRRHLEWCGPGLEERVFRFGHGWPGFRRHGRIVPSSRLFRSYTSGLRGGGNMVSFTLNDKRVSVDADANTPLLWIIRDHVGLTGTKY